MKEKRTAVLRCAAAAIAGLAAGLAVCFVLNSGLKAKLEQAELRCAELESALYLYSGDEQYVDAAAAFSAMDIPDNNSDLDGGWGSGSAADVVVAEFDGGSITRDEMLAQYDWMVGWTDAMPDEDALAGVLDSMVKARIVRAKAEELGLTEISEADEREILRQAKEEISQSWDEDITAESLAESIREDRWKTKLFDYVTADAAAGDGETVEDARQRAYDAAVEQWVSEANVQYYTDRF